MESGSRMEGVGYANAADGGANRVYGDKFEAGKSEKWATENMWDCNTVCGWCHKFFWGVVYSTDLMLRTELKHSSHVRLNPELEVLLKAVLDSPTLQLDWLALYLMDNGLSRSQANRLQGDWWRWRTWIDERRSDRERSSENGTQKRVVIKSKVPVTGQERLGC